ncbi:hypothetical protein [Mechercharimyces sp. CAU 1602]|uniref:hypothetical protein n=1 Tax=Mechercharimyces sp. CAU 1602 TaxID=2973933 RepID=UPI002161C830|nr:hypothetical protein [Mechercharimyces sp. CAU 1602]MCS1351960.1 hypothetical protein [Mechercharimyces sp. CAU 1602]
MLTRQRKSILGALLRFTTIVFVGLTEANFTDFARQLITAAYQYLLTRDLFSILSPSNLQELEDAIQAVLDAVAADDFSATQTALSNLRTVLRDQIAAL